MKGIYSDTYKHEALHINDCPSTSAQDMLHVRINDTSTDLSYPTKRYNYIKNLTDGSVGLIFEGYDKKENKSVIIKKIPKEGYWKKELEVIQKLAHLDSGLVLKYTDFYESKISLFIITDFYPGMDLYEHTEINVPYSINRGLRLGLEMARCIKECHDNKVIHLDIKCENFMVKTQRLFENEKPNIVLIDFGHSEIIPEDESIEKLRKGYSYGTNYYLCPEGYYKRINSSKSDIWSLAVCLTLILTGYYPYSGGRKEYYKNSVENNVKLERDDLCKDTVKLISDSLDCIPSKRPNIDEFIQRIEAIIKSR